MKTPKTPKTRWLHQDFGPNKATWIKVGLTNLPSYPPDCIRIQIRSAWKDECAIDFSVRIDEATSLSNGMLKVLDHIMRHGKRQLHEFSEGHKKGTL